MLNSKEEILNEVPLVEAVTPEEILRKEGYKIKLITGTAFGTQISLSKKYDQDKIKEILKNFTIKFKGNELFIVE